MGSTTSTSSPSLCLAGRCVVADGAGRLTTAITTLQQTLWNRNIFAKLSTNCMQVNSRRGKLCQSYRAQCVRPPGRWWAGFDDPGGLYQPTLMSTNSGVSRLSTQADLVFYRSYQSLHSLLLVGHKWSSREAVSGTLLVNLRTVISPHITTSPQAGSQGWSSYFS